MFLICNLLYHTEQGGAETGYGAKAQEILGQVKGRYFFSFHFYCRLLANTSTELCVAKANTELCGGNFDKFFGFRKRVLIQIYLCIRDFRHEKTKKKRGSYRGGVIDLQSHSVKFNYSDDD